jgi:hypothetical protein
MMRRRNNAKQDILPSVSPHKSGYGTTSSGRLNSRRGASGGGSHTGFAVAPIAAVFFAVWATLFLVAYLTDNTALLSLVIPAFLSNAIGAVQRKWHLMTIDFEPLPTMDHLHHILQTWSEEALGIDVESDIASKTPLAGPIPSTLWFPKCSAAFNSNIQLCQKNQEHTIQVYQETSYLSSTFDVKYLTEEECKKLIDTVEPKLVHPYEYEDSNDNKSALCRVAALYLHGGYFFDVELEVRVPFVDQDGGAGAGGSSSDEPSTTFVTAMMENGHGMFPAFLGSTPHHPVLEHALHQMVKYYDKAFKIFQYDDDVNLKALAAAKDGTSGITDPVTDGEANTEEEGTDQEHRRLSGVDDDDESNGMEYGDYYKYGEMYDDDHFGRRGRDGPPPVGYIDRSYLSELTIQDPGWRLGTHALKQAYALLPPSAQGPSTLLHEINLGSVPTREEDDASTYEQRQKWYPEVERRTSPEHKCCCNFVVHDPRTHIVHFYARFVGSTFC